MKKILLYRSIFILVYCLLPSLFVGLGLYENNQITSPETSISSYTEWPIGIMGALSPTAESVIANILLLLSVIFLIPLASILLYIVTFLVLKIFIKNHTFRRELYIF